MIMTTIALLIFSSLFAVALLHVAWAFGVFWPANDEQTLIDTVIGAPGMSEMPGTGLTLAVAAGIASAGIFALWGAKLVTLPLPAWMQSASLLVLAIIFGLRGFSSYLTIGPLSARTQPFAHLDQWFYAPLCLLICLGFVILLTRQ
ncbi:hypothetical protein MNBD_GAMMA20-1621 [hydrothermal vent metagenome]|uniref:DUF3995 domain-containing protein n=1 Tax=hydrothermal vent metagenome TaxID=652676 RepID=A0A3B0ZWN6_9ZZZZ